MKVMRLSSAWAANTRNVANTSSGVLWKASSAMAADTMGSSQRYSMPKFRERAYFAR